MDRKAVQRRTPVPVRFEFRLVPLLWRVLERRGVAEPLVYSSIRHSAKFTFDYVVCLKFIDVFDIISIWIGLIITDLP